MTARSAADDVASVLSSFTYDWLDEAALQRHLLSALSRAGFQARREVRLSPRDRPDFVVDHMGYAVAVEVKVKGGRPVIWRQLGRYAQHECVDAVVLAAGKRTLLAACPTDLCGKPVAVALLAGAL